MKQLRAEMALAAVTVVWGTTFVLVKAALVDVSAFVFLAMRFCLAAAVLILIYGPFLLKAARKSGFNIGPGLLAGTILFVAYVFQTMGLQRTTASKSAFLTGLSIPMVPFVSSLAYKVWPRRVEIAGIFIATFGMVLMTLPSGSGWQLEMSPGDLLSLLCAVTFAVHIVVVGHYSQLGGFQSLAVVQIAVAAALSTASFWFAEPLRLHMTAGVATAVLVTGLLATAVAFTTQAWAQQYTSATRAALIFTLEPPVAWLTSYLLTGERMAYRGKVGAGLIVLGILAVELTKVTIPSAGTSD